MEGSPSIAKLFTHIHYVRLVFVFEDAPEFAGSARSCCSSTWSGTRATITVRSSWLSRCRDVR